MSAHRAAAPLAAAGGRVDFADRPLSQLSRHRYRGSSRRVQQRHARYALVNSSPTLVAAIGGVVGLAGAAEAFPGLTQFVGGCGVSGLGRYLSQGGNARRVAALSSARFRSASYGAAQQLFVRGARSHTRAGRNLLVPGLPPGPAQPLGAARSKQRAPSRLGSQGSSPRNRFAAAPAVAAPQEGHVLRRSERDARLLLSLQQRMARYLVASPPGASPLVGVDAPAAVGEIELQSSNYILPYAGKPKAIPLVAARVSLPADLSSVSLLDALPPEDAALWRAPNSEILLDPSDVPADLPPPHVFASHVEYVALLRRMLGVGMVAVSQRRPRVINGLFGVPKDVDSIRLIVDARGCERVLSQAAES